MPGLPLTASITAYTTNTTYYGLSGIIVGVTFVIGAVVLFDNLIILFYYIGL